MADSVLKELSSTSLFDLTGVVAVVTGGGTGIGLMITTTLIANGATVYIIGPKQEDLDKIAKVYNDAAEKERKPGRIHGIAGDVSKKSEALRLADEVRKREGHVTVLFNNAGITTTAIKRPTEATAEAYVKAFFDPVSEADFTNTHSTNAVGPYWLTFAFLPLLEKWKESPGGQRFAPQIVMTSSMNGWTKDLATSGFSYPYMFSKAAIGQATSTLAHDLLPLGIRVNGIAPGLFVTEMSSPGTIDELGRSHFPPGLEWGFEVPVSRPVPQGTWGAGTNKDMGALVLFLVSNWFVDGETVLIDGGTMLRHPSSY
ncbi:NAD(P)-binding protein [Dichomitus squalens]|uniref:NAD(P)-binding protein n=2 Tax=Dichomitus squalens TaxID=114155 RepID=A0A4Q9PZQ8_9APHY|nr:NAD(P)-binding protein [Dichomitus squalens LYAD-421 SS1]EJF59286.1 NAD(P)-binding protein [Dichomitus squalens LYAD-421 SS1]TBU28114.1 NAD(P)-binding protein [Dichomitus squalens]TBU43472.1 NAD(P)-binding protein [Dichomitus squalens]TBU60185.1 NAD(P)-binding protein [Dichomitus squalens]